MDGVERRSESFSCVLRRLSRRPRPLLEDSGLTESQVTAQCQELNLLGLRRTFHLALHQLHRILDVGTHQRQRSDDGFQIALDGLIRHVSLRSELLRSSIARPKLAHSSTFDMHRGGEAVREARRVRLHGLLSLVLEGRHPLAGCRSRVRGRVAGGMADGTPSGFAKLPGAPTELRALACRENATRRGPSAPPQDHASDIATLSDGSRLGRCDLC